MGIGGFGVGLGLTISVFFRNTDVASTEEWSGPMPMDDIFSQEHYWTSLFMIGLFTLFFFTACGIKLQGIKVAELGRSAELKSWLKKQLVSQVQK
jgi:hypothetical protein